jgi:hypothetical protein
MFILPDMVEKELDSSGMTFAFISLLSPLLIATITPSMDLKPGQYTLMLGAENDAILYQRAIKLRII